jgi:hypothetical protein
MRPAVDREVRPTLVSHFSRESRWLANFAARPQPGPSLVPRGAYVRGSAASVAP